MIYSLSEIDALSKRAARGAGLEWGYAEEAAKSARWLAAHQMPGVAVLAQYLDQLSESPDRYQSLFNHAGTTLSEVDTTLCPLKTGAHLCDRGAKTLQEPLSLQQLTAPLLLVPYIAQLAQANDLAVKLHWPGVTLVCSAGRLLRIQADNLSASLTEEFYCEPAPLSEQGDPPSAVGQDIEGQYWQSMNELAQHIYVPASEASRRGAGPTE